MRGKSCPVPILQTIEVTRGRALTCRAYRENERNAVVFGRSLHISTNGRHRVPPLIGPVFPPGVVADRSETVPALADIPRQAGVVAPLWLRAKSAYGGGRGMFRA